MLKPTFKFGKRFCFPSAPSWWVTHLVNSAKHSQDRRPQSKILYPFSKDHKDDDDYEEPDDALDHFAWYRRYRYAFPMFQPDNWDFENQFFEFFDSQKRLGGYTETVTKMVANIKSQSSSTTGVEVGKPFDVITLLSYCGVKELVRSCSSNGERVHVESLRGKNVMVCSIFVPIFYHSDEALHMRELPYACTKAFSGDDYEVVMVPKMLRNWVDDRDAFDHFLSGFPNCLVIPFSDTLARDSVCKFLGLMDRPVFLLVDRNQKVLVYDDEINIGVFPYLNPSPWWNNASHCHLYSILDCKPTDVVHLQDRVRVRVQEKEQVVARPIQELKDNVVGLYLCKEGSFMRALSLVHRQCKAWNKDFEIVMVYVPYEYDDHKVDPQLSVDAMNHVVQHEFNISTWWVLPFDDLQSRSIWQHYCSSKTFLDELIIVGPNDEYVEPFGKQVIETFGYDAYPFTREHLVEERYKEVQTLTLEYLLFCIHWSPHQGDYVVRNHGSHFSCWFSYRKVPVKDLRGKTVFVYVDHSRSLHQSLYFELLYWYCYHKKQAANAGKGVDDFEVVFFDLDDNNTGGGDDDINIVRRTMPWFLWPNFNPSHSDFIMRNLWKNTIDKESGLVAFAQDGRILSIEAQHLLKLYGPNEIQSYNGLRNEVVRSVHDTLHERCGHDVDDLFETELPNNE